MIRLLGSPKRLCDGITRRDLMHIGGLGAFGLGLSDWFSLHASPITKSNQFGTAKACILLYKYGAPAQHETFDPKPHAPVEVRGEMKSIPTVVPGIHICEHLPRIAKIMDRLTIVRSLTHPYPLHGTVYAMTGIPNVDTKIESAPRDHRQWPFIGSIVDYLADKQSPNKRPDVPRNIALPFPLGSKTEIPPLAGPYGTWLGAQYDPVFTDFIPKGAQPAPSIREKVFNDPYLSIKPTDKITLGTSEQMEPIPLPTLDARRTLLAQFEQARRQLDVSNEGIAFRSQRELAYSVLTSGKVHRALDTANESHAVRESYGMNLFGQSTLAARRLVETGCKFVTVFFDAYGLNAGGWDTHDNHFPRLKNFLLPVFDQTFAALILDLEARGMLDETLVLCLSEHGRTPQLNKAKGGGRDHWSRAYSQVYAGGGMGQGKLVGTTDAIAGDVRDTPISPKDVLATSLHLLGIDPHSTMTDRLNRPLPLVGEGVVRNELLR